MREDLVWYHVIWNTHNSWLPGDPRGFRNHDHRIHSSGDYRNPPPKGEHANLHTYHQARTGPIVRIPNVGRSPVTQKILDTVAQFGGRVEALSVASEHVHLLAALSPDYNAAKAVVGKCKTYSSLALRDLIPGTVWSRGCVLKRIVDEQHWLATRNYIAQKQESDATIWASSSRPDAPAAIEESTARAVAFDMIDRSADTTARAVDPSPDANAPDANHFTQSDAVEVRRVINRGKGGRAVMARRAIAEGEVFERVPVLMIPRTQVFGPGDIAGRAARISWYVFEWLPTKRGYVALALGYGSIYNHSDTPNAAYDMQMPDVMAFYALRDIAPGEEILISYAGEAGKKKDLGFEATTAPPQAVETAEAGSPATGPSDEDGHSP